MNRGTRFCRPLRHHSATWPFWSGGLYQIDLELTSRTAAAVVCLRVRPYKPAPSPKKRNTMPDFAAQRQTMVDAQVRTNDVTDPRIHEAMRAVPRERFVPSSKQAMAYADMAVEVAPGRYLLDPRTFAKLLQLANVRATDSVLDVATATGYSAAIVARLARSVTALEQDADLVRVAVDALSAVRATSATVVQGTLADGCKSNAPFDVIFVNGAVETRPEVLLGQLSEGGRLVAILQEGTLGRAQLYVRQHGGVGVRPDFDATVPLLAGFKKSVGFVF